MRPNKYIHAQYKLYDTSDGEPQLIEQTEEGNPFEFITGLGVLLDAFEEQVIDLETECNFDFTLSPAQAYGEYSEENVLDLDKEIFNVDGHFDDRNVQVDSIIPLQNEEGQRFNGRVLEVTSDKVKIDLNHPLAGRTLNFKGKILVNREPTSEELTKYVQMLSGNGCSEGCECGGHCGSGDNKEGCCGKHEHDDEHCGHHHHEDGHCCGKHKG